MRSPKAIKIEVCSEYKSASQPKSNVEMANKIDPKTLSKDCCVARSFDER